MKKIQLSVFDLDETLLTTNSSYQFFKFLVNRKIFSFTSAFSVLGYFLQHRWLKMSLAELHDSIFKRYLVGFSFELLEKHLSEFVKEFVPSSLYFPAVAELRRAQHLGHYTMILSSSPDFLVSKIAAYLGVEEWKASEYLVDQKKCLCGILSVMDGETKAKHTLKVARRLGISTEKITAFSDSYMDLPLLLAVGHSVSVKPDSRLYKISLDRGWTII